MELPRLLLAAPNSGSGKTVVTCGLLRLLDRRGLRPAAYKCGPDYIDPMFHKRVLNLPSRNLDLYLSTPRTVCTLLGQNSKEAGIAVIEGVMGYYDGLSMESTAASGYDMANITQTPVILVINGRGAALSLAAQVKGFASFRPDSRICGVFLNQVSPMTYPKLKEVIQHEMGIPVVGYLPKDDALRLESRSLGLVTAQEVQNLEARVDHAADVMEKTVDLPLLLSIARSAPSLAEEEIDLPEPVRFNEEITIAVAMDRAFCFYYEDNLHLLEKMGARLAYFSPLEDPRLPDGISGLYLGGGYPELYAEQLSKNKTMRYDIAEALTQGMPCIAECGGFMYLHQRLVTPNGQTWSMVGTIAGETYATPKLQHFGYAAMTVNDDTLLLQKGETVPIHEFHYWTSTAQQDSAHCVKPNGRTAWDSVTARGNCFAGYPHLYFYSHPPMARRFVARCAQWKEGRKNDIG